MGYLVFILLIAGGFFLLDRLSKRMQIPRLWLWLVWTGKLIYSLIYIYIFTTYYGEGDRIQGDALHFMEDSRTLNELAYNDPGLYLQLLAGFHGDDPAVLNGPLAATNIWDYGDNGDWINDNRLIIRINSVIHFISGGNLYVHVLFFSAIALTGLLLIYKAFELFITSKKFFFFTICLLPSIGFFGSGLTKEAILIFALGALFWSVMKLLHGEQKPVYFILAALAILLCFFNKPYAGLVIVPLLGILVSGKWFSWKKKILVLCSFLLVSVAVSLCFLPDRINLVEKVSYKQKDVANLARGGIFFVTDSSFCAFDFIYFDHFDTLANKQIQVLENTPGEYKLFGEHIFHPFEIPASEKRYEVYLVSQPSTSYIETTPINYQGINLLKTIPECLVNTLARPFPTDPGSPLKYLTMLQNWGILIFGFFVLLRIKKLSPTEYYWLYILLIASLILLLVIGWTTPVLGAIVRYKIPVDLFMLISFFILYSPLKSPAK